MATKNLNQKVNRDGNFKDCCIEDTMPKMKAATIPNTNLNNPSMLEGGQKRAPIKSVSKGKGSMSPNMLK